MTIQNAPVQAVRKDFRLVGGSHPMHLPLAAHVWNVRPGTPLKPTPLGWDVARDFSEARAIAVTQARGGAKVHARKSATFDVGRNQFLMGQTLKIADVDDTGFVTFSASEDGPFFAESASEVHMSV